MSNGVVLCIDPGVTCGMALYHGSTIAELTSRGPGACLAQVGQLRPDVVVIEDARLQSHIWHGNDGPRPSAAKLKAIGSNVGMNRGIGLVIIDVLTHGGVPVVAVSPKRKGEKLDDKQFRLVTGWKGKSNQHERDAAMLFRAARYQLAALLKGQ